MQRNHLQTPSSSSSTRVLPLSLIKMAPIQHQSSKKRKNNKQSSESNSKKKTKPQKQQTLSDVKHLGEQLLSSKAYINNLPLLLNYLNPTASYPREFVLESLLSLQSFFTPLLPHLPSSNAKPTEDPESIYRTWVRSKFDEFVTCLVGLSVSSMFRDEDEALREVVLDTLMECVKVGNVGKFHSHIYYKFIKNMIFSIEEADTLLNLLVSKYFKYIDIRYFTYISIEKLIGKDVKESSDSEKESTTRASGQLLIRNIHHVLSKIPPLEQLGENSEYEMWNASGVFTKEGETESKKVKRKEAKKSGNDVPSPAKITKKMKMKFSKAWMSFLALPLPIDVYKEVLVTLHQTVIPYLSSPIMLCDFLTRSYDIGGVISVMALSSLFILMTEHGLEYPNLYVKLYALLEPSVFIAKHRAKFFELLDSCLKSPLLPAYLAASFAKKLSRLALTVPPSGGLVIVALIHNLLRRHPSVNCLVHKEDNVETAKDISSIKSGIDQFKNDETDLLKTNAMRSSLWEIDTLRHHYCPPVSRFVLSLENDLTVRSKTTEVAVKDFSSGSYATIFREEIRRRVKQVPLAFYKAIPTSLFSESDFSGWTFQSDNNNKSSEETDTKNSAERQSE